MPFGLNYGRGFRRIIDAQMNFVRASKPVYLRLRNFPDVQNQDWAQLGFSIAPTGTFNVGTKDILIAPPPAVKVVSVHNIGQSMGKLRFGARIFIISATFVERQVKDRGLADESLVWRDPKVVGLVNDGLLYSIEDIVHETLAGVTQTVHLTCNANELR